MQDLPHPEQLLAAVARFLRDEAGPALGRHGDQALAYQARVAANMVDTVARQTVLGPAADAAERRRLQVLLGLPDEADLAALNRRLASRLADGALDSSHPGLADHLWATTLAKLAVDQPGYDTYQRQVAPTSTGTP
jgi:Domain of unknown function (DUF6285)